MLRFITLAMILLLAGCHFMRKPILELNDVARSTDAELAWLELSYSESLERATDERYKWRVDAQFAPAFRAHRRLVVAWGLASRSISAAINDERMGLLPDTKSVQDAIVVLRDARDEWLRELGLVSKGLVR